MNITCTLEFVSDTHAVYSDDYRHEVPNDHVSGPIGGDRLTRETVQILNEWVASYSERCNRKVLAVLGRHLYNTAFEGPENAVGPGDRGSPLRDAFEATYNAFTKKKEGSDKLRLRLVFHDQATELAKLPWEFICMPKSRGLGSFLAGEDTDLILTRFVPALDRRSSSCREEALRILIVVSQPADKPLVKADQLVAELKALQGPRTTVAEFREPTRTSLVAEIKRLRPHIVHFIGHGRNGGVGLLPEPSVVREAQALHEAWKAMPGSQPEPVIATVDWLDSKSVVALFGDHTPDLVFLHACEVARADWRTESLTSFGDAARQLAYEKVPAVIAMQYPITNGDAESFARKFYAELGDGRRIDEAVVAARLALNLLPGRQAWNERSFGTPVIYLQSDEPIVRPLSLSKEEAAAAASSEGSGKVECPYPDDRTGWVARKDTFCLTCHRPLAICPQCHNPMAQLVGMCGKCGYGVGADAPAAGVTRGFQAYPASADASPAAQQPASRPTTNAVSALEVARGGELLSGINRDQPTIQPRP